MSNQETFDALSNLECDLFYKSQNPRGLQTQEVEEIHDAIKAALIKWAKITGCKNQ